MLICRRWVFISLLALAFAKPAHGASVGGMVRAGGTPLPSAVVTFHRIDPRTQRAVGVYATRTNAAGRYLLQNLPPGPYVVLVDRDGRRLYQNRFSVPSFDILFDIAW